MEREPTFSEVWRAFWAPIGRSWDVLIWGVMDGAKHLLMRAPWVPQRVPLTPLERLGMRWFGFGAAPDGQSDATPPAENEQQEATR